MSNTVINIGIIDFPEVYSLNKKLEKYSKKIVNPLSDPSTADPKYYAERFVKFIKKIIPEN